MNQSQQPVSGDTFVTDMGHDPVLTRDDGKTIRLGRYGVWVRTHRKHEVVETSNDLKALQAKYSVPDSRVVPVTGNKPAVYIVPGKFTLQIEGRLIDSFDTEEEIDLHPTAIDARKAGRQVLVYGPDGNLV
jgi:hypothetical protein